MAESPAMTALQTLVSENGWIPLQAPNIYIRPWPDGSMDTLAIQHEHDALAHRANASERIVWREQGGLLAVIAALRRVPPPEAENAPTVVLPTDSPDRQIGL